MVREENDTDHSSHAAKSKVNAAIASPEQGAGKSKCPSCGNKLIHKNRIKLLLAGIGVPAAGIAAFLIFSWLWLVMILTVLIGGYLLLWSTAGRGTWCRHCISSGQLVTVAPLQGRELQKGDIVLCKVNGMQYLHLIKAIQDGRYQIGNNIGRINGWIGLNAIYGICIGVSD